MGKEKESQMVIQSTKVLKKYMDGLTDEVERTLNDEQRVLQDSKLVMAYDKALKKERAERAARKGVMVGSAAVGVGAGVAGVAGVYGSAVPLIISYMTLTGCVALPFLGVAAGATAVGALGAAAIGNKKVKAKQKEKQKALDDNKREWIGKLKEMQDKVKDRRRLERNAVQERCDHLDDLILLLGEWMQLLDRDIKISQEKEEKLEGELKKKNGKSK